MTDNPKLTSWLCLKTAPDIGFKTAIKLIEEYGDPRFSIGKTDHPILQSRLITDKAATHISQGMLPVNMPQILRLMEAYKIKFTTWLDDDYPTALRNIFSPPLILYYRGDLKAIEANYRIGVVGTRKPTAYGREMTKSILSEVCRYGFVVISGLAIGIDTISHITCLESGTPTIAVLGCGCEDIYPPLNRELASKIIDNGAIVSEYEPGSKMEKWNFPARNRLISALSQAVFVVGGSITSGSMLTAKFALEQNREIFALPGNVTSLNAQGPLNLIKNGAVLIRNGEDILSYFGIDTSPGEQVELAMVLSDTEQKVYDIFLDEQRDITYDELMIKTKLAFGQLSVALLNLELKQMIAKAGGNSYILI